MMSGSTPKREISHKKSVIRAIYTTHDSDDEAVAKAEKLWSLMESYLQNDIPTIQRSIVNHVEYTLACTRFNFDNFKAYLATSHACVGCSRNPLDSRVPRRPVPGPGGPSDTLWVAECGTA